MDQRGPKEMKVLRVLLAQLESKETRDIKVMKSAVNVLEKNSKTLNRYN